MLTFRKNIFSILLWLLFPLVSMGQIIEIKGNVVDDTGEPLPAVVSVYASGSEQPIHAVRADFEGDFRVQLEEAGEYDVSLEMFGYQTLWRKGIRLVLGDVEILGDLVMETDANTLEEIEIVEDRPDALMGLDKRVFTVTDEVNTRGGQAADVLNNIPSVNVDLDGNLSLRGNSNVRIWIDGRPSTLLGMDDQTALQQIPASMIERVELITNPSAKYDADGTGGIINIITKKDRRKGWSGNVAGSLGTNNKYDANAFLSRREGAWTLFAGYGYNNNYRDGFGYDYRTNYLSDTTFSIRSDEESFRQNISHNFRLGADWSMTESDVISFSTNWNTRENISPEYAEYKNTALGNLVTASYRDVNEIRNRTNSDFALHYEHDADRDNKEKWVADFSYSRTLDNDFQDIIWEFTEYDNGTDSLPNVYQQFPETELEQMYVASFDYERNFDQWGRLELGWKSIWQSSDEVRDALIRYEPSEPFIDDTLRSNAFYFEQNIHALYGNFGMQLSNRWKAQVGVRLEQAFTGGIARGVEYPNNYFNLFPSGFLTYSIAENQELQLSYSRRIDRPSEWALNPIIDYEDPQNLRSGNPNLQPEYINSSELSYIWYYPGGSVSGAAYYQYSTNVFTRFRRVLPDGRSLTTFENLRERVRTGGEFTATGKFTSWLSGRANLNLYQSFIVAENLQADLNQNGFSWFTRVSAMVDLPWELQSQLTYNYQGAEPTGQGFRQAITSLDIAFSRDFLNDQLNLSLRVSDVFNTRQWEYSVNALDFNQEFFRKRESRILYLSMTYRFGIQDRSRSGDQGGGRGDGGGDDF